MLGHLHSFIKGWVGYWHVRTLKNLWVNSRGPVQTTQICWLIMGYGGCMYHMFIFSVLNRAALIDHLHKCFENFQNIWIKVMGTWNTVEFPPFLQERQLLWLPVSFPAPKPLQKKGVYSKRKKICSQRKKFAPKVGGEGGGGKFFPFRVDPFSAGRQNHIDRVSSPEKEAKLYWQCFLSWKGGKIVLTEFPLLKGRQKCIDRVSSPESVSISF